MHVCDLVATEAVARKHTPDAAPPSGLPRLGSIQISFDPSQCRTAFGRWLAENIRTTRRDDDLSVVLLESPRTRAEQALADFTKSVAIRAASEQEFVVRLEEIESWVADQRKVLKVYGSRHFDRNWITYEWPVLGSHQAEGIEDPNGFFDLCAARIRAMKPRSVRLLWNRQEAPESLRLGG
jgi:hypothetical protein